MMKQYLNNLSAAGSFIRSNDNFLIVSHVQPDGDTISSAIAMGLILKGLGKNYTLVNQDKVPDKLKFLLFEETILPIEELTQTFSAVITVDVADHRRMGDLPVTLFEERAEILNIDHHPTNDNFGQINLLQSTASATAEIIYDLAKFMKIPFDHRLAKCIYSGLLTDTGGFRYSNTSPKVLSIAAEMLNHDLNPGEIAERALETITLKYIEALKLALTNLSVYYNGSLAWSNLKYHDLVINSLLDSDLEGIVSIVRNIEGVEVAVLCKEIAKEHFKVSLRSKKHVNVGEIAKDFFGGGHARAAGFSYKGSFYSLKDKLLDKITHSEGWNNFGI